MRGWLAAAVAVLGLGGAYLLTSQWTALTTQTSPEIAYALAGLRFVMFWVLFLAALSPPPREHQLRMRRRVFYLNGVLLPLLFDVALAGGTLVVTGRGFKPGARLIVNNQELQAVTVAPGGTSITAPYPAPAPASFDVVALNPDGGGGLGFAGECGGRR